MDFVWMAKNKHKLLIRQIKLVGSTRSIFQPDTQKAISKH